MRATLPGMNGLMRPSLFMALLKFMGYPLNRGVTFNPWIVLLTGQGLKLYGADTCHLLWFLW